MSGKTTKKPARNYADHCRIAANLKLARNLLMDAMRVLGPGARRVENHLMAAVYRVDEARSQAESLMYRDFADKPPEPRLYYLPLEEILENEHRGAKTKPPCRATTPAQDERGPDAA